MKPTPSFRAKPKSRKHHRSQKGAAYERMICKRLSLWVSGLERDDLFWRSSMSGGRATVYRKGGGTRVHAQAGDISAVDPQGADLLKLFTIEVKFYADIQVGRMILANRGHLAAFWKQTTDQAIYPRVPLLFCKQNFLGDFLGTNSAGLSLLRLGASPGHSLQAKAYFPGFDFHLLNTGEVLSISYKRMIKKVEELSRRWKDGEWVEDMGGQEWPWEAQLGDLCLQF